MKKERDYQLTDRKAIEAAWQEYRRVLYQLPTGGGKSVVLSMILNNIKDKQIIIFAHKRRLLTQLKEHMESIGVKPGILFGATNINMDTANICIVSIRTAVKAKRLEVLLQRQWDYAVIDEARHSRTGSYDKVLEAMEMAHPAYRLLGLDATPYRKDKKRLDKWFDAMVVSTEDVKSLQEKGFLRKIRTYATPIGDILEQVKEVANDYQQTELSNYMRQPKYIDYVVKAYQKWGEERQGLVFAVDKAHAKDLEKAYRAAGIKVAQIDSDMEDNEIDKCIELYESGKIDLLINIEMLTEGVDLPNTACIVGARPTRSLTLYLQMGGRLTRPNPDNLTEDGILIDCCGWTEEHLILSSPKHWTLNPEVDPSNPGKKNKIVRKRADGTYTEELEEFAELVEMTPEQYIQNLSGGLEAAERKNKSVDEKIAEVEQQLAELLKKQVGKEVSTPYMQYTNTDNQGTTVSFYHKEAALTEDEKKEIEYRKRNYGGSWDRPYSRNMARVKIKVGYNDPEADKKVKRPIYAQLDASEDNFYAEGKQFNNYKHTTEFTGRMNEALRDQSSITKKAFELYDEIIDLRRSKIDLDQYKDAAEKFRKERWQSSVLAAIKDGAPLKGTKRLDYDDYFKEKRWSTYIAGLKIPSGSINNHHNKLILIFEKREYDYTTKTNDWKEFEEEKNYVKGDKVWELITNLKIEGLTYEKESS